MGVSVPPWVTLYITPSQGSIGPRQGIIIIVSTLVYYWTVPYQASVRSNDARSETVTETVTAKVLVLVWSGVVVELSVD